MSSNLDQQQIMQNVYNETNESLNVTVGATVNVDTGIVEVAIDQASDSIKIGDGTNLVGTTDDSGTRGLNSHITNSSISVTQGSAWTAAVSGTVTSDIGSTGGLALDSTVSSIDSKIPVGLTVQNTKLLTNTEFDAVYFVQNFLNGGSKSMSVDGSVTPVPFSYAPSSGQVYIKEVSFFILDNGSTNPNNFGNISSLTNGLQLQIQSKGIVYNVVNIQDNIDIINVFTDAPLLPASAFGFLNNNDLYSGNLIYDHPIILDSTMNDYIRFVVQDDLTAIDFLRATAKTRVNT